MIEVTIIGSGAVAEAMCKAIYNSKKLKLIAVAGRNTQRLKELAQGETECVTELSMLPHSDIYIIAVSDSAIGEVAREGRFAEGSVVVHTAGSVSIEELQGVEKRGVIYPMQSFSVGRKVDFRSVPLFIEGESKLIGIVANSLSDNVQARSSEERIDLHLAAVFACNFTNALFGAAYDLLECRGVDFDLYKPLIEETIAKMMANKNPHKGQSGAAKRGDKKTMDKHLDRLANNQQLSEIYKVISSYISHKNGKL